MGTLEENQCVLDVNSDTIMTCYFHPQLVGNGGIRHIGEGKELSRKFSQG